VTRRARHVHGVPGGLRAECDRLAHVHDVLVRAGAPPELPEALARPPAVAVRRLSVVPPVERP
jgi:hypothetical protein